MNLSKSSYLTGFVIGGLIGAAVALVLAPQTGSSARTRFSNHVATLNRRVSHDSSRPLSQDSDLSDTKTTTTSYEPPKIILDEAISAPPPPTEKP